MNINRDERAMREQDFHNQIAQDIVIDQLLIRESFEAPTAIENQYALSQIGNLEGKKILDLGCGAGEAAVYFASKGAVATGCDISGELLKIAQRVAKKNGVKLSILQVNAKALPYKNESFDFVFGNGVLHHVDLIPCVQEVHRVLKKGGLAIFVEPLPYNPIINIYRQLAKDVRSEDEKPLTFKQISKFKDYFQVVHHEEFWLLSLSIFLHFFFVRRWHPSKFRYWKKVIEEGESYRKSFSFLNAIDRWLLKHFSFLRPLCWNSVIVAKK